MKKCATDGADVSASFDFAYYVLASFFSVILYSPVSLLSVCPGTIILSPKFSFLF